MAWGTGPRRHDGSAERECACQTSGPRAAPLYHLSGRGVGSRACHVEIGQASIYTILKL